MKINSNLFNFSFFLSNRKKVKSLQSGAINHGGATKYNNGIYSNIPENEYISVNSNKNTISVFIPSTSNVNQKTDNSNIVNYSKKYINRHYNNIGIIHYKTLGSWYSEDNKQVVTEDIIIMSIDLHTITVSDIQIFINLAEYIKKEMTQEGVSIAINKSLCIV